MGEPSSLLHRSGDSPSNDFDEFEVPWLTKTERGRLEAFRRAQDRAIEAMMALLDHVGGRDWRRGAPVHWIMTELTDAVTTGSLSVVPPPPYGYSTRAMEHFAAAAPEPERAAAGGRR